MWVSFSSIYAPRSPAVCSMVQCIVCHLLVKIPGITLNSLPVRHLGLEYIHVFISRIVPGVGIEVVMSL